MPAGSGSDGRVLTVRVQVWVAAAWVGLMGCFFTGYRAGSKAHMNAAPSDAGLVGEVCDNGLDDDGNGHADDGCVCVPGTNQRCFVGDPSRAGMGECSWGTQACTGGGEIGLWGPCTEYGTAPRCQISMPDDDPSTAGHIDRKDSADASSRSELCGTASEEASKTATWKVVHSFRAAGAGQFRYTAGVWGSGPDDVWIVSMRDILHWNGSTWSATLLSSTRVLYSVWGSSPHDVWAVGFDDRWLLVMHWDGSTWSVVPGFTEMTGILVGIWGSGPRDVWAIGTPYYHARNDYETGSPGLLLHWNGSAWSKTPMPVSKMRTLLSGVWGAGPRDVWVTTSNYGSNPLGRDAAGILHWNGSSWSTVAESFGHNHLGAWGSGPKDVWVFGGDHAHWNGSTWLPGLPGVTRGSFFTVWGSGPCDVWAGGLEGLQHWNGATWLPPRDWPPGGGSIVTIWGTGPDDVWAIDRSGGILRFH